MLINLYTLKGKSTDEHLKIINETIAQNPALGKEVRAFLNEKIKTSVFMFRELVTDRQIAVIALICIILADITTIPDQFARAPYLRTINELNSYYGISSFDISVFSPYTSVFEELIMRIPNQ